VVDALGLYLVLTTFKTSASLRMSQDTGGPVERPFGFLGFFPGIIDRAAFFCSISMLIILV